MSNLRKTIDTQQRINEAAKAVIDYFCHEMPYVVHLETVLTAQTQILGLMELAKMHMISDPGDELELQTNEINLFLRDVRHYLQLLKPFIEIGEETEKGGDR